MKNQKYDLIIEKLMKKELDCDSLVNHLKKNRHKTLLKDYNNKIENQNDSVHQLDVDMDDVMNDLVFILFHLHLFMFLSNKRQTRRLSMTVLITSSCHTLLL